MNYKTGTVLLIVSAFFIGCGPSEKDLLKAELEEIKKENEDFKSKNSEMTVSIDYYTLMLNEISNNLESIDENFAINNSKKGEIKSNVSVGEQILIRIKNIKALLENSKLKIAALDKTLNELRKKYGEQSEEVLSLNRELKLAAEELIERENDFMKMKSEYEGEIEGLESAYETQLRIAEDLKEMIDRAFYFEGTKSVLKEKEIVTNEGGFIGIGRVKVLNANSPDRLFSQISKEATDKIEVQSKKIELISEHPEKSYTIVNSDANSVLTIVDKKMFWKQSNYLVIQKAE